MNENEYNKSVECYSDHLYRFILKNSRERDHASDIVQSAFEVLWERKDDVEFDKAKSFLFAVGYKKMIDDFRKSSKMKYTEQLPESHGGITETKQVDLKRLLHDALGKLPDLQKQLVLLKDYEGYSYEEMAGITGLNEGQVKITLYRARSSLKNALISIENTI